MAVGCFSSRGELALVHIINGMPDSLAIKALDQLIEEDYATKRTTFYLGNVEVKLWLKVATLKDSYHVETKAKSALEVILYKRILLCICLSVCVSAIGSQIMRTTPLI